MRVEKKKTYRSIYYIMDVAFFFLDVPMRAWNNMSFKRIFFFFLIEVRRNHCENIRSVVIQTTLYMGITHARCCWCHWQQHHWY
jgi:hypothetical protein